MAKRTGKGGKQQTANRNVVVMAAIVLVIIAMFFRSEFDSATPVTTGENTPMTADEIRVHYIDVGQGDSILIQTLHNAVLIDAGERTAEKTVINYLTDAGIETLDFVIATHPHSDHIGSMAAVIEQFSVKQVVMPDITHNTATFERMIDAIELKDIPIITPSVGETLTAGLIQLTVLAPGSTNYKDMNDYSIVVRMVFGQTSFVFTGDSEAVSEKEMLAAGYTLTADILKIGHHGSVSSTTDAFLDAVNPVAVVISCGADNTYGHPHKETMEKLAARDITVYRTDEMGSITMRTDGAYITLLE